MSSDSENSIQLVEDIKPKRRSSIFRPDTEPSQRFNELTTTSFPSNYTQRLMNENVKWKEIYTTFRTELQELKKKAHEDKSCPVQLPNLSFFETYLRSAEDFCCQVNNVTELHENSLRFASIRKQELEKQIEITSQKLHKKVMII